MTVSTATDAPDTPTSAAIVCLRFVCALAGTAGMTIILSPKSPRPSLH
jgi:hypothetical protein